MQRCTGATIVAVVGLAVAAWFEPPDLSANQAGAKPPATAKPPAPTMAGAVQAAPNYQVEVLWPKPLPNHWILGSVTGVAVDAQDHI